MTKNQKILLHWLQENCNAVGIIRGSNSEIAEELGWSQQYTQRLLGSLVDDGNLEILQKGTGHRPSKYKIKSPRARVKGLRSSHNSLEAQKTFQTSSHNKKTSEKTNQQVPSHNLKRVGTYSISFRPPEEVVEDLPVLGMRVHERMQRLFDKAKRVSKPVSANGSPFKRFQAKWDYVNAWNATDFVCYYSFLFQARYKEDPVLDWPKECGAARILLDRMRSKEAFKGFLQVAFYIYRGKPKGLNSFSFTSFYESVIDREVTPEMMADFEDDEVFPWLRAPKRAKAHTAYLEYQQRSFQDRQTGNVQRYMAGQAKQARLQRLDRTMKADWKQFSEVGR
jgi:hypothetical protein